jgi:RimJ/RimL family protein N-acetyltransferase
MSGHERDEFRRIAHPLQGELVRLRAFEEDDLPRINELLWDPATTAFLRVAWPEPVAGTRAWWEGSRAGDGLNLAIETLPGDLVGSCDLRHIDDRARTAGLGIFIGKAYWNQGYGADAVRTACRFGFREMNLTKVELQVFSNNPRGLAAYRKVGFVEEGRLRANHFVGGAFVDTIVMGLMAGDLR